MKQFGTAALAALLLAGSAVTVALAGDPMVGGAAMYPSKNIVQNAINSKDHTTLVALVKQAGLVQTLEGPGPFTVFAPTNEAFAKLPKATVNKVTSDKALLTKVLTSHVVAERLTDADIRRMIAAGGGKAALKTVEGDSLTASLNSDGRIQLSDAHGDVATVTISNVYQSNGIIDVIDTVMVP